MAIDETITRILSGSPLIRWICRNGRTAWIWEYMTSNLDVQNFCPDDPADMDKWQDWLTQEQVIGTMQWLFDNCWRAWPNRMDNFESKMQLWTHYDVLRWAGNYFAPFADGFKYRVISYNLLYVIPINGPFRGHITPLTGFLLGPPSKISHFVHQTLLINKMRFLGYRMVIICYYYKDRKLMWSGLNMMLQKMSWILWPFMVEKHSSRWLFEQTRLRILFQSYPTGLDRCQWKYTNTTTGKQWPLVEGGLTQVTMFCRILPVFWVKLISEPRNRKKKQHWRLDDLWTTFFRWFKPWPFYPAIGGHLLFARVT